MGRRRTITRSVQVKLPEYLVRRKCKRCGHRLEDHLWPEPEFMCTIGWTRGAIDTKSGGCECGEFDGVEWLDLMDMLNG